MKFKIAQYVLIERDGVLVSARVMRETTPRRYQVCIFHTGELLELPAGDLALPGEGPDRLERELNADLWYGGPRGPGYMGDGQGNFASVPFSGDDEHGQT